MRTFRIVSDNNTGRCFTVEFPEGKDYFFTSGRQSVRIVESPSNSCRRIEDSVVECEVDECFIESIITDVSHTPRIEVELENGDILKLSWVDADKNDVFIRLGSYYITDPDSEYPERGFSPSGTLPVDMFNYTPLKVIGDCIITFAGHNIYPHSIDLKFERYKVRRVQVVPESRTDHALPYRQLDF